VSFRDWSDGDYDQFHDQMFTGIFNEIEGVYYLSPDEQERAEELFERAFLEGWGEVSKGDREAMQDEFYNLVGLAPDDFDWDYFRESYDEING
jgi:hypothetical protein